MSSSNDEDNREDLAPIPDALTLGADEPAVELESSIRQPNAAQKIVSLPIDSIKIPANHRPRNPEKVKALAESMGVSGQLNPVIVYRERGFIWVVAGAHRIESALLNEWTHIEAAFIDGDELHRELVTIDENLLRSELSPAERAAAIGRRKVIYEELHPQTKAGVAGAEARHGRAGDIQSFANATAVATGPDERTIQRDAARAKKLGQANLRLITGTSLDSATEMDELGKLDPERQEEIINQASEGKKVSAKGSRKVSTADAASPDVELAKIGIGLIRAIEKLCEEAKSDSYFGDVADVMAKKFVATGHTEKLNIEKVASDYKLAMTFVAAVVREVKVDARAAKQVEARPATTKKRKRRRARRNKTRDHALAAEPSS